MKQRKKNKLFTLFCSIIPGAAEMYMGFMKNGLSIMTLFVLSFMFPFILDISEVFLWITVLIWFFAFFHARNIDTCDDETFLALQDNFVWEEFIDVKKVPVSSNRYQKWIAVLLILFGFASLFSSCMNMIYNLIPDELWHIWYPITNHIPKILISIVIIVIGVKMIQGKKETLDGKNE